MKVTKILPDGFGCNSYILTADGKNAVIIDCASPTLYDKCKNLNLNPVAVLLTHGHFDHVLGCAKFSENGVPVYCGEKEKPLIFSNGYLSICYGLNIPRFEITKTFKDGEQIELCGIKIKVIATSGHSEGGVCYLAKNCLFTGDTLFCESVGRCDLPTGNHQQLVQSVKKLFALDGDYKVYCGHEEDTTLNHERQFNPYIR